MLKKRDPTVFDFLNQYQVDFPINPNLGKLLRVDATKATNYWLNRHARFASTKALIVKNCIEELRNYQHRSKKKRLEADHSLFLFLHAVFEIEKDLARPFNDLLIELYI